MSRERGATRARVIEYEILTWADSERISALAGQSHSQLRVVPEVAVLRGVDEAGQKLTFLGDAAHTREILRTGAASDPGGTLLSVDKFPVVRPGWPFRLAGKAS